MIDRGAGDQRLHAQHRGIAGAEFAARLTFGDELGDDFGAALMEFVDRRPLLVHRDVDDFVHARLIEHLIAHTVVQRRQHRANALGGGTGAFARGARSVSQRAQLVGADRAR